MRIERMGREGDGLARADGRTVPVPFTLPGEVVEVEPLVVTEPSSERAEPVCRHFGPAGDACGNCALQHWAEAPMLAWKREQVAAAFAREGLEPDIGSIVAVPLHSRRRVSFAVTSEGDAAFHRRRSHDVFAVEECPILTPAMEAAIPALGRLARVMIAAVEGVSVTDCANGVDVQLVARRLPNDDERRGLARLAGELDGVVRLAVNDEIVLAREAPEVRFGSAAITPPPGAFLQATRESEAVMAALVTDHLAGAKRVVDLFAGCGTFALRLGGTVHAVDETEPSLVALAKGAAASGRHAVTVERRDLFERPLVAKELERFDAAVLDPPRAGAAAQVAELARTAITRIAYVSCNPTTLAADARVLVDAGWSLASVTPVDQFLYSPHVEAVALFDRAKVRKKRPLFG